MGQKAITIYTPESAAPHITADDDAFIYRALSGTDSGILGKLKCTKSGNNQVTLSGGGCSNLGHVLRIPDNETLALTIMTGLTGYKRYDSVVAEFIKGGGDTADSYHIKVVTGLPLPTSPVAPTLVKSALTTQGAVNQVELFRVYVVDGVVSSISQIAQNLPKNQGQEIDVPEIYVQSAQPSNPTTGALWFW